MDQCTSDTAALRGLLNTEYAFGQRARDSVKAAFLEYLAEDSLVLQPLPVPGRAFYTAASESADKLEWYPAVVDLAGSADLGFTTGPWIYTTASGGQVHGHFLTIWKNDAKCRWLVQFDGGVSHAAPANAETKLEPDQVSYAVRIGPPQILIAGGAVSQAINDFQGTSRQPCAPMHEPPTFASTRTAKHRWVWRPPTIICPSASVSANGTTMPAAYL